MFVFKIINILKHQKGPLPIVFVRRKVFDTFFVKSPLLFTEDFAPDKWSMPEILGNTPNFPWTKNFQAEMVIPPPPLMYKVFRYQNFSETPKGAPYEKFCYCETKKLSKVFLPLLLLTQIFAPD